MKRIIILVFFSFFFLSVTGQDLDNKKQQLEDIKEEIQKQNEVIEEKEKEKNKNIGNLKDAERKKSEIANKIKKLDSSELAAKQKLNDTISRIDDTRSDLQNLYLLCEKEFTNLFLIHYDVEDDQENEVAKEYVSSILKYTLNEINSTKNTKNSLELDKRDKRDKFDSVVSEKKKNKSKKKEYESKISDIQQDISRLEEEKLVLEEKKQQLEEEATAIDELITKLQSELTSDYFTYEFSTPQLNWPVKGEVIRNFGEQKSDEYKVSLFNNRSDIAVEEGTPVSAVDKGVVAFAEWYSGAGKLVIINHQNGFYSLYSHNNKLLVSKGDRIIKDQQIALSGKTGTTDVACLHFEIRKRGTPVDPLDFLE